MLKKSILTLFVFSCFLSAGAVVVNEPGAPVEDKDIKPISTLPSKQVVTTSKSAQRAVSVKQKPDVKVILSEGESSSENAENVKTKPTTASSSAGPLDTVAMAMLKAAEARDNANMQKYFKKLAEAGVETYYQPQVIAKKTPKCPPIKMELNGKNLSGKLCAKTGYVYQGKTYWVGYCK